MLVAFSQGSFLRGRTAARVMLMRYAAATLLIALLTASAVRAQTPAQTRAAEEKKISPMLSGAVTFTLPEGWHVAMYSNSIRGGAAQIHNPEDSMNRPQARLFISAYPLREKKTVGEMGNDNYGSIMRKEEGGTVLSARADGEDWRTVISRNVLRGEPRLMLEHFGVVNDKYVNVTVFVPLGSGDVAWMKQMVADFNALCESLKVDGKGSFENKVSPDIVTEQLKAGAKR